MFTYTSTISRKKYQENGYSDCFLKRKNGYLSSASPTF